MSNGGVLKEGGRILNVYSGRAHWMKATGSGLVFGVDSEPNAVIFYFYRLTYHMQRVANLLSSTTTRFLLVGLPISG